VVAEAVTSSPVGDIRINPVPEYREILSLVAVGEKMSPAGNNKGLFAIARFVQYLAERENLLLVPYFDLFPVLLGNLPDCGNFDTVILYLLFKKQLECLLSGGICAVPEIFSDVYDDRIHAEGGGGYGISDVHNLSKARAF
jgi:hypothetical protein